MWNKYEVTHHGQMALCFNNKISFILILLNQEEPFLIWNDWSPQPPFIVGAQLCISSGIFYPISSRPISHLMHFLMW